MKKTQNEKFKESKIENPELYKKLCGNRAQAQRKWRAKNKLLGLPSPYQKLKATNEKKYKERLEKNRLASQKRRDHCRANEPEKYEQMLVGIRESYARSCVLGIPHSGTIKRKSQESMESSIERENRLKKNRKYLNDRYKKIKEAKENGTYIARAPVQYGDWGKIYLKIKNERKELIKNKQGPGS